MKEKAQKLLETLSRYENILIFIKGSPDPDAIASSFAVKELCNALGKKTQIVTTQKLSLPENRLMVRKLNIPLKYMEEIPDCEKYDSYIILDHQSVHIETITGQIPCIVHIDHHKRVDEDISADFRLIDEKVGSTSTLVALLLRESNIDLKETQLMAIATALVYGIQTDTDKYSHASDQDYDALNFLSAYANNRIINKITRLPMSEQTAHYLSVAVKNQQTYRDWLITGIGFIDESDRDSIAIIADFLQSRKKADVTVVYAAIYKKHKKNLTLDVSLRTHNESINLNGIIKSITPTGGARRFKGAFQVNIDFLNYCPDKDLLWEVISRSTFEAIKEQRDEEIFTDLKGFLSRASKKVKQLLGQ